MGPLWTGYTGERADYEPTIFDRLDAAGISWKIYGGEYEWSICPTFEACLGSAQARNLVANVNGSRGSFAGGPLAHALSNGRLPSVSFVIPTSRFSAHPPQAMSAADNWIGAVVGAIQAHPALWSKTAIFVTFDDCGCFYDPVNPLQYSAAWGPRVPMLIISPYARPGYTDPTPATFGSLLAFIERTFGLPPLNPCGSVDSWDATCTDDLTFPGGVNGGVTYAYENAFDYTQTPIAATASVRTPLTAAARRFLERHPDAGEQPT
jgi:phospholipase C